MSLSTTRPPLAVSYLLTVACAAVLAGCADQTEGRGARPTETTTASAGSSAGPVAVENAAARRFIEAVNGGSVDEVMATLSDDAVVVDSGRTFDDPQAIRQWLEAEVTGVEGRMTARRVLSSSADGTELRVDFTSSAFSGTDLRYRFTTAGDQITNLTLG